jgi:diaminobutyrate-2-oxoglutarate transaminase
MQGLEFFKEEDSEAVAKLCFEQNLLIERCGPNDEVLKLMPACTIEADQVTKALEIIKNCVNKVCLKTTNTTKKPLIFLNCFLACEKNAGY